MSAYNKAGGNCQDLSRGRAYFLDLARIKEYHIFDFTGGFAVGVTAEG